MIKAIIYDCFGVLVNEWLTVIADAYPEHVSQQLWDVVKASNMGFIDYTQGTKQMADVLGMSVEELHAIRQKNEIKNSALLEHIALLRTKGYKTAILSNVSAGGITRRFTAQELNDNFDVYVESGALGITKPDSTAFTYTAQQLQVSPSECVMVDDRDDFCGGAEAAGMSAILYTDMHSYKERLQQLLEN